MECKRTNQETRWFSSDGFLMKITNWTADKDLVPSHNLCTCEPKMNIRFTRTYAVQKSHCFVFGTMFMNYPWLATASTFEEGHLWTLHATSWIWIFVCPVPVLHVHCREYKNLWKCNVAGRNLRHLLGLVRILPINATKTSITNRSWMNTNLCHPFWYPYTKECRWRTY